jgi:hypothetical protein
MIKNSVQFFVLYFIKVLLFFFLLVVVGGFFYTKKNKLEKSVIKVPIRYLPFLNGAHIEITIENKKYNVLLDTGSEIGLSFPGKIIDVIQDKKWLSKSEYIDFKGNRYPSNRFQISKVKIGKNLVIENLTAHEENPNFLREGRKLNPVNNINDWFWDKMDCIFCDGKMGVDALRKTICYFDFPGSTFYISKDLSSLIDTCEFFLDNFSQIPCEIEKYGVVVKLKTDLGLKRFLLDTGSTTSILNLENKSTEEDDKIMNIIIDDCSLGSWAFKSYQLSSSFHNLDGILGIDFFKKYRICIDFEKEIVYIDSKSHQCF